MPDYDNVAAEKAITEALSKLKDGMIEISDALDYIRNEYANNVIKTNGDLVMLPHKTSSDLIAAIHNIIWRNALQDSMLRTKLDGLAVNAWGGGEDAQKATDAFTELTQCWVSHSRRLRAERDAANAKVAEMSERLKEHALNDIEVREKVWMITGGKCFYCEVDLVRGSEVSIGANRLFHVDHLVPKALGGPDHLANYVPACGSCNSSKHARHFAEFVMSRKARQEPRQLMVIDGGAA